MKTRAFAMLIALCIGPSLDEAAAQIGGYFRGEDNSAPDVVLGAGGGEYGTLSSEPTWIHSDLMLRSNDEVWIYLDQNNDSGSEFRIYSGAGAVIHRVTEAGTKSAVLQTRSYGPRAVYSIESPEVWLEDFGGGTLINGDARVRIESIFSETVNRHLDYHVFLTPICQEAVLLFVTAKHATGFNVRGVRLDGKPSGCGFDYRIAAKRLGLEGTRLEEVSVDQRVEAELTERRSLPAEESRARGSTP